MQEYEREEEGITLGELFRVIFKRVWVVVGVTLAITAIAVLIVALLINTSRKEYRLEYTIEFPGHENSRYPDGTAFRYQNLISLATLNAVKASVRFRRYGEDVRKQRYYNRCGNFRSFGRQKIHGQLFVYGKGFVLSFGGSRNFLFAQAGGGARRLYSNGVEKRQLRF